jgi:GTP cyclohydrolase I
MKERLNSKNSYIEIEFPYFISKKAPVTQQDGLVDYKVRFDVSLIGGDIDFMMTLKVPVTTLCPCSKAISEYGAHNQRGEVSVSIRSNETVWIEDLIKIVESCASSELYSLLKRVDEKAVTERAYENPVFVEDLVRNVVTKLKTDSNISWYKVEAENYESIHNHNAYACIESG